MKTNQINTWETNQINMWEMTGTTTIKEQIDITIYYNKGYANGLKGALNEYVDTLSEKEQCAYIDGYNEAKSLTKLFNRYNTELKRK